MKEIAFLLLALANLVVCCLACIGMLISAEMIHHHWTAFHFIMIGLSIVTGAASATLACEKAASYRHLNKTQ